MKLGIALSGGGARGIAHVGVLQALEDYGIYPDEIAGASAGAIIGTFYAAGFSPAEILEIVKEAEFAKMFKINVFKPGILSLSYLETMLKDKVKTDSFDALKKKLYISVSNLNSGEAEIYSSGKLFRYVVASASIPIIFEPKMIEGKTYVDGGFLNTLPVEPLKESCDKVLGVHVNKHSYRDEIKGFRAVAERMFRLILWQNVKKQIEKCDFVIEPQGTNQFGTFEFNKSQELFDIGYRSTEKAILDTMGSFNIERIVERKNQKGSETDYTSEEFD